MKAVITAVAINAVFFISIKTDPIRASGLAAAVAGVGVKESGSFRKTDGGFLHIEHILRHKALIIVEGFLSGHALGPLLQHQADGFSGPAVVEGKGLLAPEVKEQVALAHASPQQHLNGVYAAGIVFCDANELAVAGLPKHRVAHYSLHRAQADDKSGTKVAVKGDGSVKPV